MDVQHKHEGKNGEFYVNVNGDTLARMTYSQPENKKIIIEHTEVDDKIRHERAGYRMVEAAVQYARSHQLKIVPICPFVKAVFDKKPEYGDVLTKMN